MDRFDRFKVVYRDGGDTSEVFVVASSGLEAINVAKEKKPEITNDSVVKVEEVDRIPGSEPKGRGDPDGFGRRSTRYEQGRTVATAMVILGWTGVVLSAVLFFVALSAVASSSGYGYFISWLSLISAFSASSLFLVGIAHVMRAIFDVADNSFKESPA